MCDFATLTQDEIDAVEGKGGYSLAQRAQALCCVAGWAVGQIDHAGFLGMSAEDQGKHLAHKLGDGTLLKSINWGNLAGAVIKLLPVILQILGASKG